MSIMWPYPAVFNVLDPWWNSGSGYKPLIPNDTTKAVDNTNALLEIIALAQASNDQSATHYYGAIIVFPGHAGVPNQGDSGADAGGIYYFQGPGDGSTLSSTSAYLLNPLANNQTTTGFQIQAFNSSGSSIAGGSDLGLTYACFGI
jgi:hypothetical protein